MLTRDLISSILPVLHLQDKVFNALQLMSDSHVAHLPIEKDGQYIGLVSEEDLLQAPDDTLELQELKEVYAQVKVSPDDHFLKALHIAAEGKLTVVPVVYSTGEFAGSVSYRELIRQASEFMNVKDPGALIVLEMEPRAYSFSEISRLVESNDAQITQLNTYTDTVTGLMQVTLKINKMEVSDVVATLQRYDYTVRYSFGEEYYENELRSNYDNLMHYLKL
ncbi:MAG: CBS domain-containing protein [Chitinophagales bacterium]|nr:CBS domain-containing protein [Chitinophagales bacterium]